jgi:hypothetical protein
MGFQFVSDKVAALREMRRVLKTDGRVFITVPGPKPPMFAIMTGALVRHLGSKAASFADLVFSLHDPDEITGLMHGAGFREIDVQAKPKTLRLPAPADFLWQYIDSSRSPKQSLKPARQNATQSSGTSAHRRRGHLTAGRRRGLGQPQAQC